MKNKTLKEYYNEINNTLLHFEQEYQDEHDCNEGCITEITHNNIVVFLRALQLIIEKMLKEGKK